MPVLFFQDQLPYLTDTPPKEQLDLALQCLTSMLASRVRSWTPATDSSRREKDMQVSADFITKHPQFEDIQLVGGNVDLQQYLRGIAHGGQGDVCGLSGLFKAARVE